ncbi:MAG: HD domain-containing protein [Clostridia bacterium]|nr:HD domain-containing protein [Clostridia bacterium]
MIDIQNIATKFNEYVTNYDPNNERIKLKIDHIKRVASNSKVIAENLKLNEEQVNLAIAIGFFHDIGRFEQVRIADTFSDRDSGINHGEMGVKVLFEKNFIREFIEDSRYDEIIKKAILNHNRAAIEDGLSDEELLFCKIIRDADKLDIFYTISKEEYSMESIFWYPEFDNEEISPRILEEFYKGVSIDYSLIHTNGDVIAIFYAYLYDLYFPISKGIIYQKHYLEDFAERVIKTFPSPKIHEQTYELLKVANTYLTK